METRTWFDIMPADTDGAVLINHSDLYGKITQIWLTRDVADRLALAIINSRMGTEK